MSIPAGRTSPAPLALTGSRSRAGHAQLLAHLLVGLAGWVVLAGLWVWQLKVHVPANWLGGVELILALLAVWVCFSIAWVEWNRSIYRRRHRRTRPIERELDFTRDSLGRPVIASPGLASARGQLIVSVDAEGVKRYRLASEPVGEQRAPAHREPRVPRRKRRQRA
jgi:hypothetical protein